MLTIYGVYLCERVCKSVTKDMDVLNSWKIFETVCRTIQLATKDVTIRLEPNDSHRLAAASCQVLFNDFLFSVLIQVFLNR